MKRLFRLIGKLFLVLAIAGCTTLEPTAPAVPRNPRQELVDAAAVAVKIMRNDPYGRSLNYLLEHARGAMIFPQIVKAGAFLGGEGGRGVLVTRDAAGAWSAPAFYGMGGGSIGFQLGIQRASAILVFMNERVMRSAITTGITLGVDATLAAGSNSLEAAVSTKTAIRDIYYFSNVEGLFAGLSLDGTLIDTDDAANQAYYESPEATAEAILLERRFSHPGAESLISALMTPAP